MTEVPVALSQVECNGDVPPENRKQPIPEVSEEVSDVDSTPPYCRVEPSPEDLLTEGNQEKSEKLQGKRIMLNSSMDEKILKDKPEENLFIVHKAIADFSLQEISVDEMTLREGRRWEKIPLSSSNQEISGQKKRTGEQPLEEREEEGRKNRAYQATEIEWLGFRKPSQVDVVPEEEQEVWDEEIDNEDADEDEVRVIEFKNKNEEGSHLKEEGDPSEDSQLSSSSSQPATPEEQPAFGKKSDISRSAYSRYNTISYRKIRKGNTKQRIDEFESMMHL